MDKETENDLKELESFANKGIKHYRLFALIDAGCFLFQIPNIINALLSDAPAWGKLLMCAASALLAMLMAAMFRRNIRIVRNTRNVTASVRAIYESATYNLAEHHVEQALAALEDLRK